MAHVISASTLFEKRILKLTPRGVSFQQTAFLGGTRVFPYPQVDCILMSSDSLLSFQVGAEVFSIRTKPGNRRHQETVAALLQAVKAGTGVPG
jgi:hypothetical protein